MASIRKIFLDSRINSTGTPSDFTTQLPQEIATRRTQGLVLGQFSIANVFTTVMTGYNDIIYYRLDGNVMQNAILAGQNDKLYYYVWTNGRGGGWSIATLTPGSYTMAQFAAELQRVLRIEYPWVTVTANGTQIVYDGNSPTAPGQPVANEAQFTIFSYADLTNSAWKARNWFGPPYDTTNSDAVNGSFAQSFSGTEASAWSTEVTLPTVDVSWNVARNMPPGAYDGAGFAAALQAALSFTSIVNGTVTCEYLEESGRIRIVSSKPILIYDPALLDDERWQNSVWYNPQFARVGTPLQPGRLNAANGMCWAPQVPSQDFISYQIDISGLREVYVHCSLSDHHTITSSGMRDVIGVIQLDQSWGSVVVWRPMGGLADQDVIPLRDGILPDNIRMYLTDAFGVPIPLGASYVYACLAIVDIDTTGT